MLRCRLSLWTLYSFGTSGTGTASPVVAERNTGCGALVESVRGRFADGTSSGEGEARRFGSSVAILAQW